MDFNEYQIDAKRTAIYPEEYSKVYPLLGLMGEVGEFCNKYKKVLRDGKEFPQAEALGELGDILWYFAAVVSDFEFRLGDVAEHNIHKLRSRQDRGVLGGSGDNR